MLHGSGSKFGSNPELQTESSSFIAKLNRFVELAEDERDALQGLPSTRQLLPSGHELRSELDPDTTAIFASGMAFRCQFTPAGARQITGFIVSGDMVDPYFAFGAPLDHAVVLLTDCVLLSIPRCALLSLISQYPAIERGISICAVYEQSILREWLLNIGQRNASEKVAHFLAEMAFRLGSVGLAKQDGSVDLPISQSMLADTTGLTLVHVNRTLQQLRLQGLLSIGKRRITITNTLKLLDSVGFESKYLYGDSLKVVSQAERRAL